MKTLVPGSLCLLALASAIAAEDVSPDPLPAIDMSQFELSSERISLWNYRGIGAGEARGFIPKFSVHPFDDFPPPSRPTDRAMEVPLPSVRPTAPTAEHLPPSSNDPRERVGEADRFLDRLLRSP